MRHLRLVRKGFTLIELLVVIAIIAILIALLVPAVQKVRGAAARTQCQNNMKQIGLAFHMYHDAYKRLPVNAIGSNPSFGWATLILPYLEQQGLYDTLAPNLTTGTMPAVNTNLQSPISVYLCPADPEGSTVNSNFLNYGKSNYPKSNAYSGIHLLGITDGTSNTILAGERESVKGVAAIWPGIAGGSNASMIGFGIWKPNRKFVGTRGSGFPGTDQITSGTDACTRHVWTSNHDGGCNFLMADATVRLINDNIDSDPAAVTCTYFTNLTKTNFVYQKLYWHDDGFAVSVE